MKPTFLTAQHGEKIAFRQRGLVLFFALVALVVMSLAAMALIRSADTSTLIAGNLAFQRAATASADAGVEAAINWLRTTQAANAGSTPIQDKDHVFNLTSLALRPGYHASLDNALNITADATWAGNNRVLLTWDDAGNVLYDGSGAVTRDASGNQIAYIIQRMCRTAGVTIPAANCLFSGALEDGNGKQIPLPQTVCDGAGCPFAGQTPQLRVTVRTVGPKSTVSYVQAYVF